MRENGRSLEPGEHFTACLCESKNAFQERRSLEFLLISRENVLVEDVISSLNQELNNSFSGNRYASMLCLPS